jgi:MraZ protein
MNCAILDLMANMWENVGKSVDGFFFSGSSVAKLDEKGRFVLPQEMRYGLVEEGKCEFVIGLGLGGCLAIYRKSVIQKIVARFQKMQHMAQYQKFFTLFFSTLHPTECDKIGRISLPATLKSAVGIKKDIVVAGVLDKIELWPKEVYDENLRKLLEGEDLAAMTEAAFALLNEEAPTLGPAPTVSAAPTASVNPIYFDTAALKS